MSSEPESFGDRREFWTGYQPGMRATEEEPGSPAYFAEIERYRYSIEPAIPEIVGFERWDGRDVLEVGCGMATDGVQFARNGARYTGVDFSPAALELAGRRFEQEGRAATLVRGPATDLPFDDGSFDLVYSNGVIHHLPETRRAVDEFHRVLRPGGVAIVMLYHRSSFNYHVSIMLLRRALAMVLLMPGAVRAVGALTAERPDVLEGQRELLRKHGVGYLTDRELFLSNNTDGPGNPLSKVYTRASGAALFEHFETVGTEVRFLNLRAYPAGDRLEALPVVRRLGRRWGWHLWLRAAKAGGPAREPVA